jgi:DNA polymerase (family 10)
MTEDEVFHTRIAGDLTGKIPTSIPGRWRLHELGRSSKVSLLRSVPVSGQNSKTLYDKLQIKDIDDLQRLAREHRLSGLPGIKRKTEENILKGIEMLRRGKERLPIGRVLPTAQDILSRLRKKARVRELTLAGSLRRWKETVRTSISSPID